MSFVGIEKASASNARPKSSLVAITASEDSQCANVELDGLYAVVVTATPGAILFVIAAKSSFSGSQR